MSQSAPALTLGIEEELFLVNPDSGELVSGSSVDLLTQCQSIYPEQFSKEFLSCQIELITKPCQSIAELSEQLLLLRQTAIEQGNQSDLALLACSTHPLACWHKQEPDHSDRSHRLIEELQVTAKRMLVNGMHIHIGIKDLEKRFELWNQLAWYLPYLLLLSTSSPFWRACDTGLNSYRLSVIDGLPRSGLPEHFNGLQEYQMYVDALVSNEIIKNARDFWWDMRLSCRYPTLEIRVPDVCTRFQDAISIAALLLCLVRSLYRGHLTLAGNEQLHRKLLIENRWRAQRFGIAEGTLIAPDADRLVPYKDLMSELIETLYEDAEALDCVNELQHNLTILEQGTSADRQRQSYETAKQKGADDKAALQHVIQELILETKDFSGRAS